MADLEKEYDYNIDYIVNQVTDDLLMNSSLVFGVVSVSQFKSHFKTYLMKYTQTSHCHDCIALGYHGKRYNKVNPQYKAPVVTPPPKDFKTKAAGSDE